MRCLTFKYKLYAIWGRSAKLMSVSFDACNVDCVLILNHFPSLITIKFNKS